MFDGFTAHAKTKDLVNDVSSNDYRWGFPFVCGNLLQLVFMRYSQYY